jgi:uncharacterized protein (TIGR03437 family)
LTGHSLATGATLMFDPGSLAPGSYSAPVAIASNAANGTVAVPADHRTRGAQGQQISGFQVLVNGSPAPMDYTSYGQLAFPMNALPEVMRDGQASNMVSVQVADRAPRLPPIAVGSYGGIPMPVGSFPGVNTHRAKAGDTLTIYAIGLGSISPAGAAIQPAPSSEPPAGLTATPLVNFGRRPSHTNLRRPDPDLRPTLPADRDRPPNVPKATVNERRLQ